MLDLFQCLLFLGRDTAKRNTPKRGVRPVTLLSWLPWFELNEENIKKYPPRSPGVYALGDSAKNLVYYGSTGNLEQRLLEQLANPVNDCVRSKAKHFKYLKTTTEDEARELEKELIDTDKPLCNMQA